MARLASGETTHSGFSLGTRRWARNQAWGQLREAAKPQVADTMRCLPAWQACAAVDRQDRRTRHPSVQRIAPSVGGWQGHTSKQGMHKPRYMSCCDGAGTPSMTSCACARRSGRGYRWQLNWRARHAQSSSKHPRGRQSVQTDVCEGTGVTAEQLLVFLADIIKERTRHMSMKRGVVSGPCSKTRRGKATPQLQIRRVARPRQWLKRQAAFLCPSVRMPRSLGYADNVCRAR